MLTKPPFALASQFHVVGAFNQEKALEGAFSVIVKTGCGTDGALHSTNLSSGPGAVTGNFALHNISSHVPSYPVFRAGAGETQNSH